MIGNQWASLRISLICLPQWWIDFRYANGKVSAAPDIVSCSKALRYLASPTNVMMQCIYFYDIDADVIIPGFVLLLQDQIVIDRSEDTIFIFHM